MTPTPPPAAPVPASADTDLMLVERAVAGDQRAFELLVMKYQRRIERLIDGDAAARRKLDAAPWNAQKITKRVLKHGAYVLTSLLIAHIFLSYLVSIKGLYEMMHHSPTAHMVAFGVVMFLTAGLYGAFSWFREQFCVIMCPYGRLQSALIDDDTVVRALRFIQQRAFQDIVVKDILHEVPVSRRSLEIQFRRYLGRSPAEEIRRVVWPYVESGALKPVIDMTYPLADAAAAHARMEAGDHVGKIVLTP